MSSFICKRTVISALIVAALGIFYSSLWFHYNHRHLKSWDGYRIPDLIVYNQAKDRLFSGQNIYEFTEFGNAFTYSPTAAWLFGKIISSVHGFRSIVIQWEHINLCALFLAVFLAFLIFRRVNLQFQWPIILIALLLISRYVNRDLNNGQMNIIILNLFLISLLSYLKNWRILSAIPLSLILIFKPFLLFFFFIYFLCEKKWKLLGTISAMYGSLLALPMLDLGINATLRMLHEYVHFLLLRAGADPYLIDPTKNQSLVPLLHWVTSNRLVSTLLTQALGLVAFITIHRSRRITSHLTIQTWCILLCLTLIFSAATWKEYYIFLFIPHICWLHHLNALKFNKTLALIGVCLVLSVLPLPFAQLALASLVLAVIYKKEYLIQLAK